MNKINQINIFIVDDNIVFTLALKASIEVAFKNLNIKIFTYETGESCMETFMQILPDFVILDYSLDSKFLGAVNGIHVLSQIKNLNADTSVIMLTNNDDIDVALKSFHQGASDYVVKTEGQFKKIINSISNIFAIKELVNQNKQKAQEALELVIANKEIGFYNNVKKKQTSDLIISNNELAFQKKEREKLDTELIAVNFQKAEIEKSKLIIEGKNKEITDSINYARSIQQAILPSKEKIYASLPQSFVLFKPKDIVSGDFYFFHRNQHSIFIVAADCTGHGVPGALMSMIGSEILTDAVSQSSDTSEILKYLNKGIKNSLQQSDNSESSSDGMDIAICAIDTKKSILKYAGANRPLWLIRKGMNVIQEIKGTKRAIGGLTDENQEFESHVLELKPGDTFYITTDGYADQFGGKYGKKLMSKNFIEVLLSIQKRSMKEQKIYLNEFIENWKGTTKQVDDILVIGVRV